VITAITLYLFTNTTEPFDTMSDSTKKERMMNKKELGLNFIWRIRIQLRAEGDKLWAEGDKLRAEGDKFWAEGDKLWAEGDKLRAEAILEVYGNIKLEWKNWSEEKQDYECHLETGEVFKP